MYALYLFENYGQDSATILFKMVTYTFFHRFRLLTTIMRRHLRHTETYKELSLLYMSKYQLFFLSKKNPHFNLEISTF
jgi:hypothetical protein